MVTVPSAVLFACTFNAVRSPMALAIFRHLFGSRVYAESVGVEAGDVDMFVPAVLEERGISSLQDHHPKTFDDLHDSSFEVIVALSKPAYDRAIEETRTLDCDVIYWPIEDPTGVDGNREVRLDAYRNVRDALEDHIRAEWSDEDKMAALTPQPPKGRKSTKSKGVLMKQHSQVLWHKMRRGIKKLRK